MKEGKVQQNEKKREPIITHKNFHLVLEHRPVCGPSKGFGAALPASKTNKAAAEDKERFVTTSGSSYVATPEFQATQAAASNSMRLPEEGPTLGATTKVDPEETGVFPFVNLKHVKPTKTTTARQSYFTAEANGIWADM